MRLFFLFLFLFVFSLSFVTSYSAGEKLNLSYSNITNATYPCLLINDSIYLSGSIGLGDSSCNITFFDNVTELITISSGGGGGGSKKTKCESNWNCTAWTICNPNSRMTRNCTDLNECDEERPYEERTCYFYIPKEEQPKIDEPIEEPIDDQIEIEEVNVSVGVFNDTTTVDLEEPKNTVLFILIGVCIVLLMTLAVVYFLQMQNN